MKPHLSEPQIYGCLDYLASIAAHSIQCPRCARTKEAFEGSSNHVNFKRLKPEEAKVQLSLTPTMDNMREENVHANNDIL